MNERTRCLGTIDESSTSESDNPKWTPYIHTRSISLSITNYSKMMVFSRCRAYSEFQCLCQRSDSPYPISLCDHRKYRGFRSLNLVQDCYSASQDSLQLPISASLLIAMALTAACLASRGISSLLYTQVYFVRQIISTSSKLGHMTRNPAVLTRPTAARPQNIRGPVQR